MDCPMTLYVLNRQGLSAKYCTPKALHFIGCSPSSKVRMRSYEKAFEILGPDNAIHQIEEA